MKAISVPALNLTAGDVIATKISKDGDVLKGFEVRKVERRRGCQHVHVNDSLCYDRAATVPCAHHSGSTADFANILEVHTIEGI